MKRAKGTRLVVNRDMKPIYRGLAEKHPEGFPEIVLVQDLPGNSKIMYRSLPEDRVIYFVKNDTDENIIAVVDEEMKNHKCLHRSLPMMFHILSDKEVSQRLLCACHIADILDIDLKQIFFSFDEDESSATTDGFIVIASELDKIEAIRNIAHELRHEWQRIHQPELLENDIHPEQNLTECFFQSAEIDAEAFAIKVVRLITGNNELGSTEALELELLYRLSIIERMNDMDVILPEKKIKRIQDLLKFDSAV